MGYCLEALGQAARRAKDVAALIDAARVLTFLATSKARERALDAGTASTDEIASIYRTASALAMLGRRLVAETDALLVGAQQAQPASTVADDEVKVLRSLLAASMDDALTAIEMLESVQELGADELRVAPLGTPAGKAPQRIVDELLERLRR